MIDPTRTTPNAGRGQTWVAYAAGFLAISALCFPREAVGLFYRLEHVTRGMIGFLF